MCKPLRDQLAVQVGLRSLLPAFNFPEQSHWAARNLVPVFLSLSITLTRSCAFQATACRPRDGQRRDGRHAAPCHTGENWQSPLCRSWQAEGNEPTALSMQRYVGVMVAHSCSEEATVRMNLLGKTDADHATHAAESRSGLSCLDHLLPAGWKQGKLRIMRCDVEHEQAWKASAFPCSTL